MLGNRYFDARNGDDDTGDGLSWATAWRRLNKLSSVNWDTYGSAEHVYIYLNPGFYWLDSNLSISIPWNRQLNIVGIGPVVFVNPARKKLTITAGAGSEQHTYMRFRNISFDTTLAERFIKANLYGSDSLYIMYFGLSHLHFENCFFKDRVFESISCNISEGGYALSTVDANQCGCVVGKKLASGASASALPLDHVLMAHTDIPVNCTNNIETAIRSNEGLMHNTSANLSVGTYPNGLGPWPTPFCAKNTNSSFVELNHADIESLNILSDWSDDVSFTDGRPRFDVASITIDSGRAARIVSPVYKLAVPSTLSEVKVIASETDDSTAYIDSVIGGERTIEYRADTVGFNPQTLSVPWVPYERGTVLSGDIISFIQFRITLETRAS